MTKQKKAISDQPATEKKGEPLIGPNEASQLLELLTRVPTTGFQEAQALVGLASRLEVVRKGG